MDKPLNKRQIQYQTTLEAIRAAVDQLVGETGFDAMHIRDICRVVGISPGAFYHYFPSKNALLIDRYLRTNKHLWQLYEQTLKHLHPVDALKELVQEIASYNRSRILKILTPYFKALLDEHQNWAEIEERAQYALTSLLVDRGLETGQIHSSYRREEILKFLWCFCNGITASQCMTKGVFLVGDDALGPVMDWLESLRAMDR